MDACWSHGHILNHGHSLVTSAAPNMDMMMFGMNISFFSFLISFLITLVFTLLVSLFMRKHLQNIAMVESLKSVE